MRKLLCVLLLLVGCNRSSSKTTEPVSNEPAAVKDESPVVTPETVAWKDMTPIQRSRYMTKVVTPKMREVFQAYDAKHYEKVNCATCHGKDPKERKFKMPSPDLAALPASEKVFLETVMKEKPEVVKFMAEKVTPAMAALLGRPAFNPAAPDPNAFSCNGCHRLEGDPDPGQH